jgi:hypothetical protein
MQRTNAFYIQSPRFQTAVPILISEDLEAEARFALPNR